VWQYLLMHLRMSLKNWSKQMVITQNCQVNPIDSQTAIIYLPFAFEAAWRNRSNIDAEWETRRESSCRPKSSSWRPIVVRGPLSVEKNRALAISVLPQRDFTRLHGQRLANFRPIVNSPKNSLRSLLYGNRPILNIPLRENFFAV